MKQKSNKQKDQGREKIQEIGFCLPPTSSDPTMPPVKPPKSKEAKTEK